MTLIIHTTVHYLPQIFPMDAIVIKELEKNCMDYVGITISKNVVCTPVDPLWIY